ncbi:MAG: hypothetical protein EXR71_20355 [Myxococcales bacterium]|nr:hypothetical protein [Myxococcales bacterium]
MRSRSALLVVLGLAGILVLTATAGPSRAGTPANPFVVIGVDGMDWSVVDELQAKGQLPNFKALRERGASAKLATAYGANSPIVWTTVATGRDKEDHGIVNFDVATDSGSAPVSSTMRKVPAIWNMVSRPEFARKVMMLGWWGSWPAEAVNGIVVSDRANRPVERRTSPASFEANFSTELKTIRADRGIYPRDDDSGSEDRIMAWYLEKNANAGYALTWAYLHGTDLVSHKYWKYYRPDGFAKVDPKKKSLYEDKIPEKYRAVDAVLGKVVAAAPKNTNFIVISDHGFGKLPEEFVKVSVDLDVALAHAGLLTGNGRTVNMGSSKVFNYQTADFQMAKMVRFARAGREKGGTVAAADEPAVRAELTAKLAKFRYEGGGAVFAVRDAKPYELKKGADFMVDILSAGVSEAVTYEGKSYGDVVGQVVEHSGGHGWEPPGVFCAAGPDIDPRAKLDGIRIHDITPTVLYGMGLPTAEDFDGKAIEVLYTQSFRAAHPLRKITSYGAMTEAKPTEDKSSDEAMLEQLRQLGYIE